MKNFDWCVYTYKHRRAFRYILEKLIDEPVLKAQMRERAKVHDMDKMLMYLFLDQYMSQKEHVRTKPHHLESGLGNTYLDLVETVIDYECAPYTKPDKPLNAFDFTNKLLKMGLIEKGLAEKLIAIMKEFGIASSYLVTDDKEGMEYMQQIGKITEEMILMEVIDYIQNNDTPEMEFIRKNISI